MKAEPNEPSHPAFGLVAENGVLRARGPLVFATAAAAFASMLDHLPSSGSLAVDLSGVTASDSAGLSALIEWRAEAARRGVHLRMSRAGGELRSLARLADLDAELFE